MFKIIWILLSCITLSSTTLANTNAKLNELAIQFVEAKNARQQPSSSANDVDHYLSLLADNFIDEHVKHNFTYSDKKTLRADMLNKLKDKIIHSKIKINDLMVGKNVVFIKLTESGKVKPSHLDNEIEYESINLLSLEFNDVGLITHIRRHNG